jgi:hypothetical protein
MPVHTVQRQWQNHPSLHLTQSIYEH